MLSVEVEGFERACVGGRAKRQDILLKELEVKGCRNGNREREEHLIHEELNADGGIDGHHHYSDDLPHGRRRRSIAVPHLERFRGT